ncbi:Lipid A 3-O-deacylase (PagL) [Pedobacter suwonensis]|uniref:Lipid A 3-O-deacylase (PagL) n=1 Tax=Pedobacter suwonensis TaxID=332999 RepID=A0A1I0TYZ6_9SPHI|nr:acyloxyacyl hydrolase [Pedobacter suwonensis]SFA57015.1 Lipid A 3-O-deacylase (PagL) [Pedobacter suwonensis]
MKKQLLLLLILVTIGYSFARAQIGPENRSIIFKPIFGTHINNDQGHLFQDQITGLDAAYFKDISQNSDKWIGFSGAKSYGIGFVFRNLSKLKGTKDTSANAFGQIYGLVAQMDFQLFKTGRARFNFTPGVGLGYTNKYYYNNTKNRFLGSAVNEIIKADLGMELAVSKYFDLLAGFGFLHASNGGATVPNGGLNTGNVYIGLKLNNPKTLTEERKSTYTTLQRNSIELSVGLGARGVFENRNKSLYKSGLYAGYNFYLNDVMSLKAGADAVYYYTTFDPNNYGNTFQNYGTSYDQWRTGISIGADINLWRVTVAGQIGKYIHFNRLMDKATWYWTFGPTFNITPHLGLQAKTYMHFAQADFVNWGVVYKF